MKKRSKRSRRKPLAKAPQKPRMPLRLPNDPEVVILLLDESERMAALGNRWASAKIPNPLATDMCFRSAWAHAVSAAWLRCKLKGEFNEAPLNRK